MPIWFNLEIFRFDLSFLVPISEDLLRPIETIGGAVWLFSLSLIVVVYVLIYLAQNETRKRWRRILFGVGSVVLSLILTAFNLMIWVEVVYVIFPKMEQGW